MGEGQSAYIDVGGHECSLHSPIKHQINTCTQVARMRTHTWLLGELVVDAVQNGRASVCETMLSALIISVQIASGCVLECHTTISVAAVDEGIFMLSAYQVIVVCCGKLPEPQPRQDATVRMTI